MTTRRYLILFTNKQGDKFCQVIEALTMWDAVAKLPLGSKVKAVELA
jgi:hypothetical protein